MEIKDQRTKSLLWLLLILVIAVTAGAGSYLLTLNDQQKTTDSLQSQITSLQDQVKDIKGTTTATTPTTANTDATADWKTYTNTIYGFSFKYPKEWSLQEPEISTGTIVVIHNNTDTQDGQIIVDLNDNAKNSNNASSYWKSYVYKNSYMRLYLDKSDSNWQNILSTFQFTN